ncbi:MAG: (Fe-S)-binding protein [Candidatus Saccharicenans sp.]|nr:(Fe-S)-binding protein [Candidatus Saccharicenans sp.]
MEESGFRSGAGEASGGKKDFSLVRAARPVISREGKMRIPLAAGMLKRVEKFPAPAVKSFSSMLKEEKQKEKESGVEREKGGKKVALFPGCLIENFFPETGLAAYRVLRRSGFEVEAPFDGCCGFPAVSSGFVEEARKEFKMAADKLLAGDYYRIVTFCPTCTSMLRELGPGLLTEIVLDEEKARIFKERVRTFVSFANEEGMCARGPEEAGGEFGAEKQIGQTGAGTESRAEEGFGAGEVTEQADETEVRSVIKHEIEFKGGPETESGLKTEGEAAKIPKTKITYHDSCHHKFVLKEERLSRELLEKAGYELAEMENSDICCGFAGVFSVEKAEISEELLRQKLEAIEKSGAEVVAVDCPGCLLQIKGGLLAAGKQIRVRHTAELITGE